MCRAIAGGAAEWCLRFHSGEVEIIFFYVKLCVSCVVVVCL